MNDHPLIKLLRGLLPARRKPVHDPSPPTGGSSVTLPESWGNEGSLEMPNTLCVVAKYRNVKEALNRALNRAPDREFMTGDGITAKYWNVWHGVSLEAALRHTIQVSQEGKDIRGHITVSGITYQFKTSGQNAEWWEE